jgi:hypothetical protein
MLQMRGAGAEVNACLPALRSQVLQIVRRLVFSFPSLLLR